MVQPTRSLVEQDGMGRRRPTATVSRKAIGSAEGKAGKAGKAARGTIGSQDGLVHYPTQLDTKMDHTLVEMNQISDCQTFLSSRRLCLPHDDALPDCGLEMVCGRPPS